MSLTIRDATTQDLPSMLDIYSHYVLRTNYSFEYLVPTMEDFSKRFETITESYPWLVLLDEDRIVGYAYASRAFQRAAYQWDADVTVYLNHDCHRKGYASLLYDKLLQFLYLQGYYTIYAIIADANLPSLSFHRSKGFLETGHLSHAGYKNGSWIGIIWTEKKLRSCIGQPESTSRYLDIPENVRDEILLR